MDQTTLVFIDCEFTSFEDPTLLSVGCADLGGSTFYAELDLASPEGSGLRAAASGFVEEMVLGQFGLVPGACCSPEELSGLLARWLEQRRGAASNLSLVFDFQLDWDLVVAALLRAGSELASGGLVARNIQFLADSTAGREAAERCWREVERQGLSRHHALADALALREAYLISTAGQGR